MKIDKNIIKELTNYLNEFNLTEIEYTDKDTKIKVSKSNSASSNQVVSVAASPSTSAEEKPKAIISGTEVKSPIIGTAYHSPEPGAKKFSEIGKRIKKGETIMIVEAMKTMNHVPSTADGIIKEICVEDGQPVEYGQTIIIVE
jgi:acetyl-CoA carboxylase biotin carboxyl carrier protein